MNRRERLRKSGMGEDEIRTLLDPSYSEESWEIANTPGKRDELLNKHGVNPVETEEEYRRRTDPYYEY